MISSITLAGFFLFLIISIPKVYYLFTGIVDNGILGTLLLASNTANNILEIPY